ncbi:MAG: hypothetical protein EXR17_00210 [Flavobacteriaceae bacterium]|nr:hypothetical protein [Flavobacteriaceae bacterium]
MRIPTAKIGDYMICKLVVLFMLGLFPHYSLAEQGPVKLIYGRIALIIPADFNHHAPAQKVCIDSIFGFTESTIQDVELLLGYTLRGEFRLSLYTDLDDYHLALGRNVIWIERQKSKPILAQEHTYPIYINTAYSHIKDQLQYCFAHALIKEFLYGTTVSQQIRQVGYKKLPPWFIQGFCAYLAEGWNSSAADEYTYFESQGAFRSPNAIDPLGAQVYGKKIWRDLFINYGKPVFSAMWFVVKYTGNAEDAFQFQTGQSFEKWNTARTPSNTSAIYSQNEIEFTHPYKNIPIKNLFQIGQSQSYAIEWFSIGEQRISIYNSIKRKMVWNYIAHTPSILSTIQFPISFLLNTGGLSASKTFQMMRSQNHRFIVETRNFEAKLMRSDTLSGITNLPIFWAQRKEANESIQGCWIDCLYGLQQSHFYSQSSISQPHFVFSKSTILHDERAALVANDLNQGFYSIGIEALQNAFILKFIAINEGDEQILRRDTLTTKPIIRGMISEGIGKFSYVQSQGEVWRLRFYQFSNTADYRWQSEIKNSFYNQSFSSKTLLGNILEYSFANKANAIRRLDLNSDSKGELETLVKNNAIRDNIPTIANFDITHTLDKIPGQNNQDTWHYISSFTMQSWLRRLQKKSQSIYSGNSDSSYNYNFYYLSHGGLFIGNQDYTLLPYMREIGPALVYNSPFTPQIRLCLLDVKHKHQITMGLLSTVDASRIGLSLCQTIQLPHFQLEQSLITRNRNYRLNENANKKNTTTLFTLGLSHWWLPNLQFFMGAWGKNDLNFSRVSNPGFANFQNKKYELYGLQCRANHFYSSKKPTTNTRYFIETEASAQWGTHSSNSSKSGNMLILYIRSKIHKSFNKWVNFKSDMALNLSRGTLKTLFWVGGSEGWTSNNMWETQIHPAFLGSQYIYQQQGGFVRGFINGARIGTGSLAIQNSLHFRPYQLLKQTILKQEFSQSLNMYTFLDVGTAFLNASPADPDNPFNTQIINMPDYSISVTAKRNPYIVGIGMGLSATILKTPLRYEFAWGIKEGKMQSLVQHLCMSWNF